MSEIKYMLGRIKGSLDIAEGNINKLTVYKVLKTETNKVL